MAKFYKKIELNEGHWSRASAQVANSPIYENSHRGFEANQVGILGEVVLADFLEKKGIRFRDDRKETTRDYLINNMYTLDLKTKDRTVLPEKHFANSVPLYNHGWQRPDFYYFISLLRDRSDPTRLITRFTHACMLGGIDIATLEQEGTRWKAGQVDPANNTKFWTDCINVSMDQLIDNNELLKIFRKGKK